MGAARPATSYLRLIAGALRALGTGLVGGFVAGLLVGGGGSRVAMYFNGLAIAPDACARMLTANGFQCGAFTIGGTIALLMTGAVH